MSTLIVNQCEYGCGIVGHFDLRTQEFVGEDLTDHYNHCPKLSAWIDRMNNRKIYKQEAPRKERSN